MFTQINYEGPIAEQYTTLAKQLNALLTGESDRIANLSNASALLNQFLPNINWVGFYVLQGEQLVLGPFQGLPACVRIPIGRGVCGTAVSKAETMVVKDVHEFPGHIACDAASQSEIVIPLKKEGEVIGVLDIDSPIVNRFSKEDQEGLEPFVETLLSHL
ncbi:GAF domain-containing protein [Lysinibacillus sphaericus]|uniref:GAF domain-containing protein n=1 Tax=Lysinibacillus sphaericus TaxID=1421 RepID=UPI0018CCE4A9|nr:GAF domain-containing protein [Lysinibacillus sphaericus]MBG9453627.1 GAF domain-containing protein [Lysinibacillus sphaericus]MBG9480231.1 GAF domain-containing protein [Lysinibacillus sphaericus]MBG9594910.1 GAF domain-containing protein [Lysinibacillus sphaericus]